MTNKKSGGAEGVLDKIKELVTISLAPNERLLVTVSEEIDLRQMDLLVKALSNWIGPENAKKIMVLKDCGAVNIKKVKIEEGNGN